MNKGDKNIYSKILEDEVHEEMDEANYDSEEMDEDNEK